MSTPNSRLVLSYNICFQAMCHDGIGSAAALGKSCTWLPHRKGELTHCAQNISHFLDGVPSTVGSANFDFVGLQEANKIDFLKQDAASSLAKLSMIKYKSTPPSPKTRGMHIACFYDPSKYTLLDSVCDAFNSKKHDRPFQILLLKDKLSGDNIIFANVHVPHGSNENLIHKGSYYSQFEAVAYDLSQAVQKSSSFDNTLDYTIIMTGDFNECEWDFTKNDMKNMKWQPFGHAGVNTSVEISNFVFSCSQPDGCWHGPNESGTRGGDYVFSSGSPAKISVPTNYVFAKSGECKDASRMINVWQSDHLPVMAHLK